MVPPPEEPATPTEVFAPTGGQLFHAQTYALLPEPVTVEGNVRASDGSPVAADLIFETTAIYGCTYEHHTCQ